MRVLFGSAEIVPMAKTGGLADVSGALPAALADLGADVHLTMPAYAEALDRVEARQAAIPLGDIGHGETRLIRARTPDTGLPIWLVDCPSLYRQPGGLYTDDNGNDRPDNCRRFVVFAQAVARLALGLPRAGWQPDVVHLNDWHLGLVPALLAAHGSPRGNEPGNGPHGAAVPPSVFTIHNLAFLGLFPAGEYPQLGLPPSWFSPDGVEFYGQISLMKAGIRFADRLTTVSPRYAQEILRPEFGCGLDGLLRSRADALVGILNGVDYERWTPADRRTVPFPYDLGDLAGKRRCKAALQAEAGLERDPDVPLIGFISRLTEQKMADVLPEVMPELARQGAQFVLCAGGDREIEGALRAQAARLPGRVAVRIGYDESVAKRILAGADMLAAPARFEPCGLVQMYAMRYGTLPVARKVGGLRDTVVGYLGPGPTADATGFLFDETSAGGLSAAIARACSLYRMPLAWRKMQIQAMRQDFRWRRSAQRYKALYETLTGVADADAGEPAALEGTGT